jgi:hypothetical protein
MYSLAPSTASSYRALVKFEEISNPLPNAAALRTSGAERRSEILRMSSAARL